MNALVFLRFRSELDVLPIYLCGVNPSIGLSVCLSVCRR